MTTIEKEKLFEKLYEKIFTDFEKDNEELLNHYRLEVLMYGKASEETIKQLDNCIIKWQKLTTKPNIN
jgi:hypothetical protein